MHLSPQKQRIYDLYKDTSWHCSSEVLYMRDFRKRVSELREMGFNFESRVCGGDCGVKHTSNIHTYRLVDKPMKTVYQYELINGVRIPKATLVPL